MATKACEYTAFKEPRYLDALAVAYAADGQTNQARISCQRAWELAAAASNAPLAKHLETQLSKWLERPAPPLTRMSNQHLRPQSSKP
jgi:hypothetical protein